MNKFGKVIVCIGFLLIFLAGCSTSMNTPTSKVEEFLGKYQKMDDDVSVQLDEVLSKDDTMTAEQKDKYRSILEKQYQNLSYKIENEEINGEEATVEIEVLDYATIIRDAKKYYEEHKEEIESSNEKEQSDNDNLLEDAVEGSEEAIENSAAYIDYKLKELQNVSDTTTYNITFYLIKKNGEWQLQNITDLDLQKIHGLYEG